ncbi:MAG: tripartite tricarboxylate transporter TctB family protein [Vicinamibacterales bacterium]
MSRDAVFGCILLAIAAGYYAAAAAIPRSDLADAVGPAGLPVVYAAVLGALSIVLIVRGIRRGRRAEAVDSAGRTAWLPAMATLSLGIAYIVIVPWAGYLVTIAGLLIATSYRLGGRFSAQVVGVGVGGALVLWVLFVWFLGIEQPPGIWPVETMLGAE